jgi:hypothetical protein
LLAKPPFFYENLHEILNSHLPSEVTVFPTIFDSFPFSFLNYAIFARVYREIQKKNIIHFSSAGQRLPKASNLCKKLWTIFSKIVCKSLEKQDLK